MSSVGLHPDEEVEPAVRVSPERLAEFDRLYAQGGMDAVMTALKEHDECRSTGR